MRRSKIVKAGLLILCLWPLAPAAGMGMGGGGAAPAVGIGMSIGSPGSMGNTSLSYAHGSPAASNPAVALMEARQRRAQVALEIEQARKAGRSVAGAETNRRKGEGAIEANHPGEAMQYFTRAENDLGIVSKTTAMGAYSQSPVGSVAPGGTELSGAIVH